MHGITVMHPLQCLDPLLAAPARVLNTNSSCPCLELGRPCNRQAWGAKLVLAWGRALQARSLLRDCCSHQLTEAGPPPFQTREDVHASSQSPALISERSRRAGLPTGLVRSPPKRRPPAACAPGGRPRTAVRCASTLLPRLYPRLYPWYPPAGASSKPVRPRPLGAPGIYECSSSPAGEAPSHSFLDGVSVICQREHRSRPLSVTVHAVSLPALPPSRTKWGSLDPEVPLMCLCC